MHTVDRDASGTGDGGCGSEKPAPNEHLERLTALFERGPAAILTGAGMSTDSGIPDYRGTGSPPRTPMSIEQFTNDAHYRRRFWAGARIGALRLANLRANAGHEAVARLEQAGHLTGVITQNVDGLHTAAGAVNVAELHGSGSTMRCITEGHRFTRAETLAWFDAANPGFVERNADAPTNPDGDADVTAIDSVRVPVCPACGATLRPDVVYFGEHVPKPVFAHAEQIIADAEMLIIAGSSLAVNTGVRLVHRAETRGIPIAVINRGPTAVDRRSSLHTRIEGGTSETLSALAAALER
ncbi:Sir2 family NAD-dependent protein deacetylase [Leucobacter sp. W1478]|uniref:Sir2 family NAD-dependent protein deacetylase n=1 Tax=Leucobacter sp. W1478 TaxID=3439065 RepID=UPI003F37AEAA